MHWGGNHAQHALEKSLPRCWSASQLMAGEVHRISCADVMEPLSPGPQRTTSGQVSCSRPTSETADFLWDHSFPKQRDHQLLWCPVCPAVVGNRLKGANRKLFLPVSEDSFEKWCMSHNSFYWNLFFSHLDASAKDMNFFKGIFLIPLSCKFCVTAASSIHPKGLVVYWDHLRLVWEPTTPRFS